MSGLESEPFKEFRIKKEDESCAKAKFELNAVPQEMRKEMLEKFDLEAEQERAVSESASAVGEVDRYLKNAGLLLKSGDYELAQNILTAVLAKDPKNIVALEGLAASYLGLDRADDALEIFREMASLEPTFKNYLAVADTYYKQGKDSSASHWYYKALDSQESDSPELFEIFKNLGNISVRGGDLDSAEEAYNKAYTLNPDSDTLLVNYGTLEIQRGQYEQALIRFRQAAEINSENEKAWVGLALIHREHGDHDLSWANIEKALDIAPENETAMRLIVDWAYKDNRMDEGIRQLEDYLTRKPDDFEMRLILAQFLVSLGRYKHAKNHVETLECKLGQQPEIVELISLIEKALS